MTETKKIVLRYPNGETQIDTSIRPDLVRRFLNWIIQFKHFSEYDEDKNIFTFPDYKYVSACNIKWRKLCNNM